VMNLVSLLIASAVVSMSIGKDQNDALRIVIALVAVAIIAVAIYISKQRPVAIGDDGDAPAPPAPPVVDETPSTVQLESSTDANDTV
jgi:K(+)-stimulated pyrophosphate-energized sodium pump